MKKFCSILFFFFFCFISTFSEPINRENLLIADENVLFCYPEEGFHTAKVIRFVSESEKKVLDAKYKEFLRKKNSVGKVKSITNEPFFVVDIDDFMKRLYDKGIYDGKQIFDEKEEKELSKRISELFGLNYQEDENRIFIASFVISSTSNPKNLTSFLIRPAEEENPCFKITRFPNDFVTLKNKFKGNDYFTGLGYTYDIRDCNDRIGITEFVLKPDTKISINIVVRLSEFLSNNFYRIHNTDEE